MPKHSNLDGPRAWSVPHTHKNLDLPVHTFTSRMLCWECFIKAHMPLGKIRYKWTEGSETVGNAKVHDSCKKTVHARYLVQNLEIKKMKPRRIPNVFVPLQNQEFQNSKIGDEMWIMIKAFSVQMHRTLFMLITTFPWHPTCYSALTYFRLQTEDCFFPSLRLLCFEHLNGWSKSNTAMILSEGPQMATEDIISPLPNTHTFLSTSQKARDDINLSISLLLSFRTIWGELQAIEYHFQVLINQIAEMMIKLVRKYTFLFF